MNPNNTPADQPKVRCYGYQAALTVEGTQLTSQHNPHGIATVNLDIAPKQGSQVDWSHKISCNSAIQNCRCWQPSALAICLLPNSNDQPKASTSNARTTNCLYQHPRGLETSLPCRFLSVRRFKSAACCWHNSSNR